MRASLYTLALACGLAVLASSLFAADKPDHSKQIAALIVALDDDDFNVREKATDDLVKLGDAAIESVSKALNDKSPEVQVRAKRILKEINDAKVFEIIERIAKEKDDAKISIEDAMWAMARFIDVKADRQAIDKQLDALAAKVRKELPADADPAKTDPKVVIAAIRKVIFKDEGFTGLGDDDAPNPKHSAIDKVLESKRGLPILLSHIVVAVGDRLKVPIVGMAIPTRYMCKYDGERAPKGFEKDDIMLDPFGGGEIVFVGNIVELIGQRITEEHTKPCRKRDTVIRMLTNLANHLEDEGSSEAGRVGKFIEMLNASRPGESEPSSE